MHRVAPRSGASVECPHADPARQGPSGEGNGVLLRRCPDSAQLEAQSQLALARQSDPCRIQHPVMDARAEVAHAHGSDVSGKLVEDAPRCLTPESCPEKAATSDPSLIPELRLHDARWTPRQLGQAIALDMASGEIDRLPRLTESATPDYARTLFLAYCELRDAILKHRRDDGDTFTLRERIEVAGVLAEIDAALDDARAWLRRCARKGGRGVPAA